MVVLWLSDVHTPKEEETMRRRFTEAEDEIIRKRYAFTETRILAKELGRTTSSIHNHAIKLGVKKSKDFLRMLGLRHSECREFRKHRFRKGHVPSQKGRKWSEWMSKEGMKRASKGWKNLALNRHRGNGGRNKKSCIAMLQDGRWLVFPSLKEAAEWAQCRRENIRRCCIQNQQQEKKRGWGRGIPKPANYFVNTDHTYYGIRWYYEDDTNWTTKIKES